MDCDQVLTFDGCAVLKVLKHAGQTDDISRAGIFQCFSEQQLKVTCSAHDLRQVEIIDLGDSLPRDEPENGDAPLDTQELVRNPMPLSAMLDRNDSVPCKPPQALCRISCFVNLFWIILVLR